MPGGLFTCRAAAAPLLKRPADLVHLPRLCPSAAGAGGADVGGSGGRGGRGGAQRLVLAAQAAEAPGGCWQARSEATGRVEEGALAAQAARSAGGCWQVGSKATGLVKGDRPGQRRGQPSCRGVVKGSGRRAGPCARWPRCPCHCLGPLLARDPQPAKPSATLAACRLQMEAPAEL